MTGFERPICHNISSTHPSDLTSSTDMAVETVFPVFHKPRSGTIFFVVLVFTSVDYTVRGRKAFVCPRREG
jgi:hypothetical protein